MKEIQHFDTEHGSVPFTFALFLLRPEFYAQLENDTKQQIIEWLILNDYGSMADGLRFGENVLESVGDHDAD